MSKPSGNVSRAEVTTATFFFSKGIFSTKNHCQLVEVYRDRFEISVGNLQMAEHRSTMLFGTVTKHIMCKRQNAAARCPVHEQICITLQRTGCVT